MQFTSCVADSCSSPPAQVDSNRTFFQRVMSALAPMQPFLGLEEYQEVTPSEPFLLTMAIKISGLISVPLGFPNLDTP